MPDRPDQSPATPRQGVAQPGFRFLLRDGAQPFRPATCFIVADPKVRDPKAWTVELDPPGDATWVHRVDDVKTWMLHDERETRQIFYDAQDPRTPFRELDRSEVFRSYVRKVLEKLPESHRESRKLALMPAIADEKSRKRYKAALEAAIPGVTLAPEPEMVAEYFRLLQRSLELEKGENNVFLVIDVGAATANMTAIVSRRDETILELDSSGAKRDLRVRALRGDSSRNAGAWVDRQLAEMIGVPEALWKSDGAHVLREVEKAKLHTSRTGNASEVDLPSPAGPIVVQTETLVSVSKSLWSELTPLFLDLCKRLYENQTCTEHARGKSEARFKERGVLGPADAHLLIDAILLAGGTSLLPGFESAMLEALFGNAHEPTLLRVGNTFPIAAAAGGLAHVLRTYDPPRLRPSEAKPSRSAGFEAQFAGTLRFPLVLGVKEDRQTEVHAIVLDPDDPFVDDGGRRPIEGGPVLVAGSKPRMRLVPGGAAGVSARRGRRFDAVRVRETPGRMELEWDPIRQRASIASDQVEGTKKHLWIDAQAIRRREETSRQPFVGDAPEETLAVDGTEDVVLDFGMSKLVALAALPGWISTGWLEQVVRDGLPEDPASTRHDVDPEEDVVTISEDEVVVHPSLPTEGMNPSTRAADAPAVEPAEWDRNDAVASRDTVEVGPPAGPPEATDRRSGRDGVDSAASDGDDGIDWRLRTSDQEFSHGLQNLREAVRRAGHGLHVPDIVVALLALAVRPVVLLAGPPGCGKSTLVRVVAHVLGKRAGCSFHEVPVQAHWENDDGLFGEGGLLRSLVNDSSSHLVLFDELNLTRPEYYLSRFFYAVEHENRQIAPGTHIAPCRAFGTLNIDDTSRAPSPKVLDRCFLVELDQVAWDIPKPIGLGSVSELPVLAGLPTDEALGATTDERVSGVLSALHDAVDEHSLRHDLLPSRRALGDIRALLGLHHRLDLEATDLLGRDDVVDRVLASRVLVKLSGAFEQLQPALDAVEKAMDGMEELPRTRRRLKLARQQAKLGFVSPWQ